MKIIAQNPKGDVTPEQVEEATMEIIKDSMKILKNYDLRGLVTNIEIGLLPIHRRDNSISENNYNFVYNDLFSLLINRKK